MALRRVKTIMEQVGYYWRNGGIQLLTKRIISFSISPVLAYTKYYIVQVNLYRTISNIDEPLPKVKNFTLKIVFTNKEADELAREGFDIRAQKASFQYMEKIDEILEAGGILFSVFIKQDLAYAGWVFPNNHAKEVFGELPYSINYPEEVCMGTDCTHPKYRGLGLAPYAEYHKQRLLAEKGILRGKEVIYKNNLPQLRKAFKSGYQIDGELLYIRILIWKFWREKSYGDIKE